MGNENGKKGKKGPAVHIPTPAEIKTYIMIAQNKLTLFRNKKIDAIRKKKLEIAKSLKENNLDVAKAKMDSLIREEDYITSYDILGPLLEILKERVTYIVTSTECPPDLRAQLDTVIYASTRLEFEELYRLRDLIMRKYGSAYITKAESNADKLVNINLVEKLKIKPASDAFLTIRLKQLCKEKNIPFEFPCEINSDIPGDIGNPFEQQGVNPYGGNSFNPFGQPDNNPYGPQGGNNNNPYGPPSGNNNNPYGPPSGNNNPYGPPSGNNNNNQYCPQNGKKNNNFGGDFNDYMNKQNNQNNDSNPFADNNNVFPTNKMDESKIANKSNLEEPVGKTAAESIINQSKVNNPYENNNDNSGNPFSSQVNNNNDTGLNDPFKQVDNDPFGKGTVLSYNENQQPPNKEDNNPYSQPDNKNNNDNPFTSMNSGNPYSGGDNPFAGADNDFPKSDDNPYGDAPSTDNAFGGNKSVSDKMFVNKKVESYNVEEKNKEHLPTLDSQIKDNLPTLNSQIKSDKDPK